MRSLSAHLALLAVPGLRNKSCLTSFCRNWPCSCLGAHLRKISFKIWMCKILRCRRAHLQKRLFKIWERKNQECNVEAVASRLSFKNISTLFGELLGKYYIFGGLTFNTISGNCMKASGLTSKQYNLLRNHFILMKQRHSSFWDLLELVSNCESRGMAYVI